MSNTTNILNVTYDLTNILSSKAINTPVEWTAAYNEQMNGIVIISFLSIFAMILFIWHAYTNSETTSYSESAMYSGLITSVVGLLLFLIDISNTTVKIVEWYQLLPIWILTGAAILVNKSTKNY